MMMRNTAKNHLINLTLNYGDVFKIETAFRYGRKLKIIILALAKPHTHTQTVLIAQRLVFCSVFLFIVSRKQSVDIYSIRLSWGAHYRQSIQKSKTTQIVTYIRLSLDCKIKKIHIQAQTQTHNSIFIKIYFLHRIPIFRDFHSTLSLILEYK